MRIEPFQYFFDALRLVLQFNLQSWGIDFRWRATHTSKAWERISSQAHGRNLPCHFDSFYNRREDNTTLLKQRDAYSEVCHWFISRASNAGCPNSNARFCKKESNAKRTLNLSDSFRCLQKNWKLLKNITSRLNTEKIWVKPNWEKLSKYSQLFVWHSPLKAR